MIQKILPLPSPLFFFSHFLPSFPVLYVWAVCALHDWPDVFFCPWCLYSWSLYFCIFAISKQSVISGRPKFLQLWEALVLFLSDKGISFSRHCFFSPLLKHDDSALNGLSFRWYSSISFLYGIPQYLHLAVYNCPSQTLTPFSHISSPQVLYKFNASFIYTFILTFRPNLAKLKLCYCSFCSPCNHNIPRDTSKWTVIIVKLPFSCYNSVGKDNGYSVNNNIFYQFAIKYANTEITGGIHSWNRLKDGYQSSLNLHDTRLPLRLWKISFSRHFCSQTESAAACFAPVFVNPSSGLNDNLNGVERPVSFCISGTGSAGESKSYSLWPNGKLRPTRNMVFHGEGLYTDMNAIRRDEDHRTTSTPFTWISGTGKRIISKERTQHGTLVSTVRDVYKAFCAKRKCTWLIQYDYIEEILPREIFFITTQELADMYPGFHARGTWIQDCHQKKGAVFLMQIGDKLENGENPMTDVPGLRWLGIKRRDILAYYPVYSTLLWSFLPWVSALTEDALDPATIAGCDDRRELPFQKAIQRRNFHILSAAASASPYLYVLPQKSTSVKCMCFLWPEEVMEKRKQQKRVQLL